MNKKTKVILTILCLVIAIMDIYGIPGVLLKINVADVDPYIIPLMVNFIFIVISTIGMGIYFGIIYKKHKIYGFRLSCVLSQKQE